MTALVGWLLYLYFAAGAALVAEAWYDAPPPPPPAAGWGERVKMVLTVLLAVAVWPALIAILGWPTSRRWTRW